MKWSAGLFSIWHTPYYEIHSPHYAYRMLFSARQHPQPARAEIVVPRPRSGGTPKARHFGRLLQCVALCALSVSALAAHKLPEPALHPSRDLCADIPPISEAERQRLREAYRSGEGRAAQDAVTADLLARITRMGKTIAELRDIIAGIPTPQPCPAVATAVTTAPAATPACPAPAEPVDREATGLPWPALAVGAAILGLLAGLVLRHRKALPAPIPDETAEPGVSTIAKLAARTNANASAAEKPKPTEAEPTKPPAPDTTRPPSAPAKSAAKEPAPDEHAGDFVGTTTWTETFQGADDFAVDEADLSLELADVMVSMGLAGGAAQTLEGHIRQHPRQALFHWLKLLDVYRRFGQRDEFDKASRELQDHFNIAPPLWQPVARPTITTAGLEDYPHVISRIRELWPRKSCAQYLNRLLDDNRGGTRTGFSQPVIEEIMLLLNLLRG
jgi:hypothetical protein